MGFGEQSLKSESNYMGNSNYNINPDQSDAYSIPADPFDDGATSVLQDTVYNDQGATGDMFMNDLDSQTPHYHTLNFPPAPTQDPYFINPPPSSGNVKINLNLGGATQQQQ